MNPTTDRSREGGSRNTNLFRLSIAIALFYWLLESLLHAFVFESHLYAGFIEALFKVHAPNELWMRLLIIAMLIGFGFLAEGMQQRERQSRQREEKVNRLLRFLSHVNQHVQRQSDEQELLEDACRSAVETGGFRFAWAGMQEGDGLRLAAWAAADEAIGQEVGRLQAPGALLRCLGCQEVLTGEVAGLCELASRRDCSAPWLGPFLEQGCRHAIVLPLREAGRTVGVFEVYAGEEGKFSEDELAILQEVADDISVALTHIAMEAERRQKEAELRQRLEELERFQRATMDREFRIKALRDEIAVLKGKED